MIPRSVRAGALASAGLALFYVIVVASASGSWEHLTDQARRDWYYLLPIVAGFRIQVSLISELRRRHRLQRAVAAAGGAGAGASTDVSGVAWPVESWSGDGPGGHHREGELRFGSGGAATGTARLALPGFPEPVEVTWDLGG